MFTNIGYRIIRYRRQTGVIIKNSNSIYMPCKTISEQYIRFWKTEVDEF